MQIKFLKQIVEQIAGEVSVPIVDLLSKKNDVNEFNIAKKLGLTINQTRNILYRLSHVGILSSTRKKDKRKGWYIYFWTLNVLRSLEILEEKVGEMLEKFEADLKNKKSKRFYRCNLCGVEISEENALLTNFECPECGEIYELSNNEQNIEEVAKVVDRLKKELDFIKKERKQEAEKEDKKLERKVKKIEKEKKEKRRLAREVRLREKKKLERKANKGKKKTEKKSTKKTSKNKSSKKKPTKKKVTKKAVKKVAKNKTFKKSFLKTSKKKVVKKK